MLAELIVQALQPFLKQTRAHEESPVCSMQELALPFFESPKSAAGPYLFGLYKCGLHMPKESRFGDFGRLRLQCLQNI